MNAPMNKLRELKKAADKADGFAEKALAVFKAKGFTATDIEEAKQQIREAWGDANLKELWINWINSEHVKGWR